MGLRDERIIIICRNLHIVLLKSPTRSATSAVIVVLHVTAVVVRDARAKWLT